MRRAAADAPNLALSVNISAFNLGNAIGAALGGAVISAGLGYPMVAIAGAATSAMGLLLSFSPPGTTNEHHSATVTFCAEARDELTESCN